ncbi:MAG: hypothetical protein HC836_39150 [Richelia sp. RM2_1_2]|nr:hypothetical protein [Richelia sp. RM2_1_2]
MQHRVSDADYSSEQVQTFFTFLESQGFPTDLIVRNLLEYLIENHAPQFINILHRIPKGGSRDKFNYMLNATQFYIEHFDSKQDEA